MVHLGKQRLGFAVADELLSFRIPIQRTAKRLRDVAKMAGGDGPMCRLRRANRRLAAPDAVEKVADVVCGLVCLKFTRHESGLEPVTVGGVKLASVDVHPAVLAGEARPHWVMRADAAPDTPSVFAMHLVVYRGLVHRHRTPVEIPRLNPGGAALILVQRPVGDVVVVPNPVH